MEDQDLFSRMLELSSQGFLCSQILLQLALDVEGKENPDLIRAMGGLTGGMGFAGKTCGALTGGCCLIGYFTAKGERMELANGKSQALITEFEQWFEEEIGATYGGINCSDILADNPANTMLRCPGLVQQVYEQVMAILQREGYDV